MGYIVIFNLLAGIPNVALLVTPMLPGRTFIICGIVEYAKYIHTAHTQKVTVSHTTHTYTHPERSRRMYT